MLREEKTLPKDVLNRLPAVTDALSKDDAISAVYIFGSAANGELKPLSDLDFAVLLHKDFPVPEYLSKHLELIGLFNEMLGTDEIDLVLLNHAPNSFCHNVLKTGKLVYYRDKKNVIDFREQVTKIYLDFKYFKDCFD